jgi:4-alpha-glucanotransferase
MKFLPDRPFLAGVSFPLSALRSHLSAGVGEFPDLVLAAQFAAKVGWDVIQLLPVNDTGFENSPYNALSAFALHPVFLRLDDLPGSESQKEAISALRGEWNTAPRVFQNEILRRKLPILHALFEQAARSEGWDQAYRSWLKENPWGAAYVVFSALRARWQYAGWQSWPEAVSPAEIPVLLKKLGDEAGFYAWLQIQAQTQFRGATSACADLGVAVKGDIPILLNEDSADVWSHPEYFDLTWRAGSPPDGENPTGQSWGFPSFKWKEMEKDGYSWWQQRLLHADQFYHAYRIDHVLGFFRLWVTPSTNGTAQLGHFEPSKSFSREQLVALGFNEARLVWMSEPHIFGLEIRERLGDEASSVIEQALVQVGAEDLYRFKPEIQGEKALGELRVSEKAKASLFDWFRNRTLLHSGSDAYVTSALYYSSRAYTSLSNEEKWNFERLVRENSDASMELWAEQGRRLLGMMRQTTEMLVCAEDLGSVPACVPGVLKNLSILSLRVVRWARDWNSPGQPWIPVQKYPHLSVCTPSVHDTSTLRQWWSEETDHRGFLNALGLEAEKDGALTPEFAQRILSALMNTGSRLCLVPLQDWFLLDSGLLSSDPSLERVNLPGTVGPENWSYRMKPFLEDLMSSKLFVSRLQEISRVRRVKATA